MATRGTATIREAVAVFDDPAKLEAAVSDLQSSGFDRADISFLAEEALQGEVADTRQAEDDARTPRDAGFTDTDVRQRRVFGTSMAATVAAFAAAGFTVMTGGAAALAAGLAAAAAAGVGAAGTLLGKDLEQSQRSYLGEQMRRGGVLLWVRTKDPAAEQRACDVLRRHSAHDVHVHEVPATA
jgi:hypothetical protein